MPAAAHQLKSELAQMCVPRQRVSGQRTLAWVNSVCLLFLIVAWSGLRLSLPTPHAEAPPDEPVPIIVTPTPPQAAAESTQNESSADESKPQQVVVVTPNSPAIDFSMPTIGNVVLPNAIAAAPPPAEPLRAVSAPKGKPALYSTTGRSGDRPIPPYPERALRAHQQGTVILRLIIDAAGVVQSVDIKETTGSSILDRSAAEFVKRHWVLPTGVDNRAVDAIITYEIQP